MSKSLAELTAVKQPRLGRDARWFNCIDCQYKVSKTSNKTPCFELELETNGNPVENVNGQPVDPNGLKGMAWVYITERNAKRLETFYKAAGINDLSNITIEAIVAQPNAGMFIGKRFLFTCETKVTQEFKEDGVTPIKGSDGQPVIKEMFQVGELV